MINPELKVKNLYKTYRIDTKKIEVTKNISFSVESGNMIWIYGNSGAGKSTFLNLITGIDSPDSGEIEWGDKNINKMTSGERAEFRLENCGLIFQFFELIKSQTVFDNVSLPLKIQKKSKNEIKEALMPLFESFDLKNLIHKKPNELSGGERQRVSIIRALSCEPKYILADEITSSLDSDRSHQVYEYLYKYLKKKSGVGIFVSHDPIIESYADKTYKMVSGSLNEVSGE